MKRIVFLALLLLLMMLTAGCGDDAVTPIIQTIRSADPLNKSIEWSSGKDELVMEQLKNGNPAHNLSPAELIFYCARENNCNPVLLLALLENQDLLGQEDGFGDFELRLYHACNYEVNSGKYNGFFPQLVASTFQFWLDRENGMSFAESYQANFAGRYTLAEYMAIYAGIVDQINQQTGSDFPTNPDPTTSDILDHFHDLNIEQIQSYLESCPNTALKRKLLFKEAPLNNSVQY